MSPSPAGGPATINGIVYQLLWSLLRGAQIHVTQTDLSADAIFGTKATLVLEPVGGGGDVQEHGPAGRRIQQLKAGAHSWSLQGIVGDVLPDIYLAVELNRPDDSYEFVTEGWMGDWKEAYGFFRSLRTRQCPATDVPASLDDTRTLRFAHQTTGEKAFWPDATYTERTLFERIARGLLEDSPAIGKLKHDYDTLHRNLWHLLGHFEFIGNQSAAKLQDKIDRLLLEIVPSNTHLSIVRNALLFDMARRASVGGVRIEPGTFFAQNGLQAVPLSHWAAILDRSQHTLRRQLRRLGYVPEEDVCAAEAPSSWPLQTPLLGVAGESGQGKSWWLYNLALALSDTNPVVLLLPSTNDVEKDMQQAARAFADIANHDDDLRLARVAERLRSIGSPRQQLWLYLLLDGVQDAGVARRLALLDWEEWGIVPIIAGNPDAIRAFADAADSRGTLCEVGGFSTQQLMRYLSDGDSLTFYAIPGDVRETLRRPLLARLYRDLARETPYRPENEYELYNLSWEKVFRTANAEERLAEASLQHLTLDVLAGSTYPWSSPQIASSGMAESQLAFLLHRGVLQEAGSGTFRICHDRLLNWAVAQALVTAWRDGRKTAEEVTDSITRIWRDPYSAWGRLLGYVPMDVFWLLARASENSQMLLDSLLTAMESLHPLNSETMYRELLPPVGSTIVPALVRRMEARTTDDPWAHVKPLAEGLAAFPAPVTTPVCLRLLRSGVYSLLGAACEVLERRPDKAALESLWTLLQDIHLHEDKYQKADSSWALAHILARECSEALKSCAMLDPDWLEQIVLYRDVDSRSLASLAYMLPDMPDGQARSRRCQARLQARLQPKDARGVAHILYRFPDPLSTPWLRQQVSQKEGSVGAVSFQALARLNSGLAADALPELPDDDLCSTRHWTLLPLLMKEPEAVKDRFLGMLRASDDPLRLLNVFQGFEDELSETHLDVALDALEQRLASAPDLSQISHGSLWMPLDRICAANSLEALACLRRRRGSPLEEKLTEWMLQRSPRQGVWVDHLGEFGLEILYRIGGKGFTQVVNAWLRSGFHFGIVDALKVAFKCPDDTTIQLLRGMAIQSDDDRDRHFQRYLAVEALALAEAWEPLVEAVLACGFNISREVMYARLGFPSLSNEALAPAIQALLSQQGEVPPGALLVIGMAQREDMESKIVDVLEHSSPASDTEQAALLALTVLTTREERTARLIVERQKQAKLDPEFTRVALINNQSGTANSVLHTFLKQAWDIRTAISLLNRDYAADEMLEGLRGHLRHALTGSPMGLFRDIFPLIHDIRKEEHKRALFTPDLTDTLRDMAFTPEGVMRTVGTKEIIMRGLSIADPGTAYVAALRDLTDPRTRERDGYPSLLVAIEVERAIENLFEVMRGEKSAVVRAAIGRALHSQSIQERLQEWAQHADADRRQAACRIAQYQEPTSGVLALIRERLDDPESDVYEAAVTAMLALRRLRRQADLLSDVQAHPEAMHRWPLLDAAIQSGDMGDKHTFWRDTWTRVYQDSPHMVQNYIEEAIKERREEIEKEQQKEDR